MVYASRGSSGSENFEMKFVRKHNKIILSHILASIDVDALFIERNVHSDRQSSFS